MQFNDMPLRDGTKDAVAAMGYEDPTPIQRDAIPLLLAGNDVIGRARTGTGKTAAFGIPLIEAVQDLGPGVHGLVLVPTRELAKQVQDVLREIAQASGVRVVSVYGGAGFENQIRGLRQPHPLVVVACPGRLLDLEGRGDADLSTVKVLILDEADRMLDMGFIHDMRRILKLVPTQRQTSLFSATIDDRIKRLSHEFLRKPVTVEAEEGPVATVLTEQFQVRVEKPAKPEILLHLLANENPEKALVFMRTKHTAKRMADRLNKHGWSSVALQGNMTQGQRERAMQAFRDGDARVLVATDVAARGLDVPDITHVVNYDLPMEDESYVHRIGRTGRNGRAGRSFTFVQSDEHHKMRGIETLAGSRVPSHPLAPTAAAPRGPDEEFRAPQTQQHARGQARSRGRGRSRHRPASGAPRRDGPAQREGYGRRPGGRSGGRSGDRFRGSSGDRSGGRSGGARSDRRF
jgi:ATP-dependent RNA helicase RhlE